MSDSRPSRFYVLGVYLRRLLRWQRTSYPYLSIDAFAKLADYRLNPVPWRFVDINRKKIEKANIIFCRGEELEELFMNHPNINAKIVICGNSDFEFHEVPNHIPGSVRALFLQNSFISDNSFIFTLPIGLENLRWGVNGHPRLLRPRKQLNKSNVALIGPFGKTHPLRKQVVSLFREIEGPWVVLPDKRISASEYSKVVQDFNFIVAVRGNGIDTHRHWESLYRGLTPIILEDSWSSSFRDLGLPIILINNWECKTVFDALENINVSEFDPKSLDFLWMPYWEKKIRNFLS